MRKLFFVLTPLLLTGCIKQSASYYVSDARDHAITVRAEQEYFWDDAITLTLVAAHFPECQRAMPMEKVPKADVAVELFDSGEGVFTVRSGAQVFQVDSLTCTQLPEPPAAGYGEPVGVFMLGEKKMEFAPAAKAAPPAA